MCGNDIVETGEVCDGTSDAACPGQCQADCTCPPPPSCGDNVVNQPSEVCDGTDDAACPGQCQADCTCPPPVPPTMTVVSTGDLGDTLSIDSGYLRLCIPRLSEYLANGYKLTTYYMRIIATNGSDTTNLLGSLIHLTVGGVSLADLQYIVFYDKPLVKFERLIETYLAFAPKGLQSFVASMPVWLKEKLFLRSLLEKELISISSGLKKSTLPPLLFSEHHESHAASAFYPSPFEKAGVLCMDGVGEWATTSAWLGDSNSLTPLWEIPFPHSFGLLYSAFTYYTGLKVNSG